MSPGGGQSRDLAHDRIGAGPRLLLLHGGSGRRQWFDGLAPLLVDRFELLVVDLPGHGESRHTPGRYRLDDTAAVIAGLLDGLGGGPVAVFGHSHGAHVALVLAAERPDLVSVLIDGDAPLDRERLRARLELSRPLNRGWARLARSGASAGEISELLGELEVSDPETGAPSTLGALVGGSNEPYRREMAACLAAHDPDFLDAVTERFDDTYARLDPEILLPALRCPLVLFQADPHFGGMLTDADITVARSLARQVVVRRLPGIGHGLQFQDPRPVAAAVLDLVPGLLVEGGPPTASERPRTAHGL